VGLYWPDSQNVKRIRTLYTVCISCVRDKQSQWYSIASELRQDYTTKVLNSSMRTKSLDFFLKIIVQRIMGPGALIALYKLGILSGVL